jgi:CRISPR system Cascade subunit CasA
MVSGRDARGGDTHAPVELSLLAALRDAHQVTAIVGDNPTVTVALHRLLLAIVHRCCGPRSPGDWMRLWQAGRLPTETLEHYLARWSDRFDLFSEEAPFYQTAGLPMARAGSSARLLRQADNNPTLFDHATATTGVKLAPGLAARLLVAYHAFDTGGIITGDTGRDFAKAAPLVQSAVVLLRGETLFQTLLLNAHRYDPENGEPWEFRADRDLPAWERSGPVQPGARFPDGYLDLLTWQSRRLLLFPHVDVDGSVSVPKVVTMKGYSFPEEFSPRGKETMVAYRKVTTPKPGSPPWFPLGFREDRALWRDSLALFEWANDSYLRPRSITWLHDLAAEGAIPSARVVPLDAYGLAVKQAKCLFWREDRLPLPLELLNSRAALLAIQEALEVAERVGRLLQAGLVDTTDADGVRRLYASPARQMAEALVGQNNDAASAFIEHHAPSRAYWPELDEPFRVLVLGLARAAPTDLNSAVQLPEFASWTQVLQRAVTDAFRGFAHGLGTQARALRAAATAERQLHYLLRSLLNPHRPARAEEHHDASSN